jgi:hypothetical protein
LNLTSAVSRSQVLVVAKTILWLGDAPYSMVSEYGKRYMIKGLVRPIFLA